MKIVLCLFSMMMTIVWISRAKDFNNDQLETDMTILFTCLLFLFLLLLRG